MSGGRRVGLLHPGEMGAAIGAALVACGHEVRWASAGRSEASAERAAAAALIDVGTPRALLEASEVVLSICPPAAAEEVAAAVAAERFEGVFCDCNAVAPETAARIAAAGARTADGGIVGRPPAASAGPRLYLSGDAAAEVASLFEGTAVEAKVLPGDATAASALKMLYAAWTKGSAALLLAVADAAQEAGLAEALTAEWRHSQPSLPDRLAGARDEADAKAWRWSAEMQEIAATLESLGQPPGFHQAAASIFNGRVRPM